MKTYAIRDDLAFRDLDDSVIIIDPVVGKLHTLSGVGGFIWHCLDSGVATEPALLQNIMETFEVEQHIAQQDLQSFLADLGSRKLLTFPSNENG